MVSQRGCIKLDMMWSILFMKRVENMKRIFLNILPIIAVLILVIIPLEASGQNVRTAESPQGEERQLLKDLLEEVRQLRRELLRTNAASQRLLITLERIRLQQTRLDSLARSLQTVRSQLDEMSETRTRVEAELRDSEDRRSSVPENYAATLESQIKEMKYRLTALTRQEEQAHDRESDLNNELQKAQTNISDLNKDLDTMMKQLGNP